MDIIKLPYGVEAKYHIPFTPYRHQQDAIFYTGMNCIATITCAGYAVDVYCDGETKAHLFNTEGEHITTLYTPSDFIDAGLDTDDALKMANEQNLLQWDNNSWFDLYCYGEHLDAVHHELIEALSAAVTYVQDQANLEHAINTALDNAE